MPETEKSKFQGMIPSGLKRELEIVWREGKDPTIQTMNDLVTYCVEQGLAALARTAESASGKYAAQVYALKRRKDSDEMLGKVEFEVQGYVPRDFSMSGVVRPIRAVEEG